VKKKMLVCVHVLRPGGVERSAISFIENMKDTFDIDVLLFNKDGVWMNELPPNVNIIEVDYGLKQYFTADGSARYPTKNPIKLCVKRSVARFCHSVGVFKRKWDKTIDKIPYLENQYDVAIAFTGAIYPCIKYILEKTSAKHKFTIYHNDVTKVRIPKYIKKNLFKFDKVFFVSRSIAEKAECKFKKQANKIDYLYNFIDAQRIVSNADIEKVSLPIVKNFISVSRLSPEKKLPRTLKVFGKLKKEGFSFHWTIIGDGPEKCKLEKLIRKYNLNDQITLAGMKTNPFPYIKAADMLLLTSEHESFGLVIIEALTLGVPVLSTRMISSDEVVGDFGIVCENNAKGIYQRLRAILQDESMMIELRKKAKDYQNTNKETKEKFIDLVIGNQKKAC